MSLSKHEKLDLIISKAEVSYAQGSYASTQASDLVVLAQSGCADAFGELFQQFAPRLLRFLEGRYTGYGLDLDSVLQDAFAKAWASLDRYDARFQFSTWIYTIANRIAMDQVRAARIRRTHVPIESQQLSEYASHQAMIDNQEFASGIWGCARKILTEDQYSALWLRYNEDMSVKEVARVLKKTQVGVRVLLHRGRHALQEQFQANSGELI